MKKNSGIRLLIMLVVIIGALILSIAPLGHNLNLGLDLQGGAQVVLQAIPDEGEEISSGDMDKLISVLENRVNELGVSEPIIQREGSDRIIVELAGVGNPDEAIDLIGKTAKLEFLGPDGNVILTGEDLDDAYASINQTASASERNQVVLKFNAEGSEKFYQATAKYVKQIISIRLDGVEISAPRVKQAISGGTASISGSFETFEDAANLAALLRGGALPVNLTVLSKETIGATLGSDSLQKSLTASAIGFILLFLFLIAYYRLPGIWACFSLFVYILLLLWALYGLKATLTLTSIAGFILSVGMAVDSNIIIYERIREELFHGKSLRASIEAGFKRAMWTILDSNITTLIAGVVLYFFGSGTIKGFALTLSLGLVASMFTAVLITRVALRWMSDIDFIADKKFYGI